LTRPGNSWRKCVKKGWAQAPLSPGSPNFVCDHGSSKIMDAAK
jgi:hypothetical protein